MKNILTKISLVFGLLFSAACTDLDEELYDRLSATTFYQTEEEIEAGLANVYYRLMDAQNWWFPWQLQEVTTDVGEVPTRTNGGWYDGGIFIEETTHTWDATHSTIGNFYGKLYGTIATANSMIDILELAKEDGTENLDPVIAEVRTIRAWCYLYLCDMWGNVPIVTVAQLDPNNLPTNASRKEVFDFIETELTESIQHIPSVNDVNREDYYPRLTREAAHTMLARLYLNAEVYSGQARWDDCIKAADAVIASNAYELAPSIWDSFTPENEGSHEIIFGLSQHNKDITSGATGSNWVNQLGLHPLLQQKFDLPFTPWGGPRVNIAHYETYDEDDFRRTLILDGPQYSSSGEFLFDILPLTSVTNADPDEGLISIKYKPDTEQIGMSGRNDQVLLRYADVLMMKAEALYRTGNVAEATSLVNMVRARNFETPKPLTNMTLDDILEERGREFLYENTRRTDLIRFGKFLTLRHQFKETDSEPFRLLFPIPQSELDSNPRLKQNPGY